MSGYGMLSPSEEANMLMSLWQRQAQQFKGNGFLPANAFDNLKRDPNAIQPMQIPTSPFGSLAPSDGQQGTDPMASLMQQDQAPQAPVGGMPASSPLNEMTMMQLFGGGGDMGADFG